MKLKTQQVGQAGEHLHGEIVAQAITREDEVITAKADLDIGTRYRKTIFDFGRHRQPESYRLIVERKGSIPPP
jgi:predicted amidohydrolase